MEDLIAYLRKTYNPLGLICYGSYSNGTQNEQSDFDALLLTREGVCFHDTSVCNGVRLDVFVRPVQTIQKPDDYIQIYNGLVLIDETGVADALVQQVRQYVDSYPKKSPEEKAELKSWCDKMLCRGKRGDAEGRYRSHWLLTDSLEIYCDMRDQFYFGPKKTIRMLEKEDPKGYLLFCNAMEDHSCLDLWINYIFNI